MWEDRVIEQRIHRLGLVVGRFQVDSLHEGHINLIRTAKLNYDHLVIGIGDSGVVNQNNPLPFEGVHPTVRIASPESADIIRVRDVPNDDKKWVENLSTLIRGIHPHNQVVCFGGEGSHFIKAVQQYWPGWETVTIPRLKDCSASFRRSVIRYHPKWNDVCFRMGVIYATGERVKD